MKKFKVGDHTVSVSNDQIFPLTRQCFKYVYFNGKFVGHARKFSLAAPNWLFADDLKRIFGSSIPSTPSVESLLKNLLKDPVNLHCMIIASKQETGTRPLEVAWDVLNVSYSRF